VHRHQSLRGTCPRELPLAAPCPPEATLSLDTSLRRHSNLRMTTPTITHTGQSPGFDPARQAQDSAGSMQSGHVQASYEMLQRKQPGNECHGSQEHT